MKKIRIPYKLFIPLFASTLLFSCVIEDEPILTEIAQQEYQPTQISGDTTTLFFADGNLDADTVWVYEQGGPEREVEVEFGDLKDFPNYNNYLTAYVHQVLTYNNALYERDLNEEQAALETNVNSEILDRVIRHFKDQGKTVIVFGHSYGAFVLTKYLADKGSALADKYVIMAGRLDAQKQEYEGLINREYYYYPPPTYETPTLHPTRGPENRRDSIELLFTGVIGKPRYTQELADVDLSKVIYSFANNDEAVGRFQKEEKDFLESKNVQIVAIENGDHGSMFTSPYKQTIYKLITQ